MKFMKNNSIYIYIYIHICIYIYIYIHAVILHELYLYVPDEGSLLPKYRDCTTSNDFELYIHIYIHIVFLIICPLLISLYNIAVLIIICRFESTLLLKYANPCRNSECQIFHLFRCVLSSMLPLRSVGRSNFDKGCIF